MGDDYKVLGWGVIKSRHSGTHLQSQHLGSGDGKKISSRIAQAKGEDLAGSEIKRENT